MPLIQCSECNSSVSDKAATCPNCGNPIATLQESISAGAPLNTIQETSKKFKLQTLLSVALIIGGILWVASISGDPAQEDDAGKAGIVIMAGLLWYIINRFRIWWHHK